VYAWTGLGRFTGCYTCWASACREGCELATWKRPDLPAGPLCDLNDALHRLRERSGLSSRQIATAVGRKFGTAISHTTIHRLFTRPILPPAELVLRVAEVLLPATSSKAADSDDSVLDRIDWLWQRAAGHQQPTPPDQQPRPGPPPGRLEPERRVPRGETSTVASTAARPVVPRQLPPAVPLTGRDELLAEITSVLRCGADSAPAVALLVGPGGVGKTALALAVAHRLCGVFPDGQLHAELRSNHHGDAVDPRTVAGRFLRALGVEAHRLPDDRDELMAMYRSELAGRRVLVVLDDAVDANQVRQLLPGTSSCGVLVTSRQHLSALVAATRWSVPVLTAAGSRQLLARTVGRWRVAAEPDAAAAIVELCGRLPLAVAIAAARLVTRRHWTLVAFQSRLAEERRRLDELAVGDLDVRASILLSYHALDPQARELFRRLGLVETPDWPAWVADSLIGSGMTTRILDELVDAHLVESLGRDGVGQERLRLHNLVADFARERLVAEDAPEKRAKALSDLVIGWLTLASEADRQIQHDLVRAPELQTPPPPPSAAALARDTPSEWFDAERHSLLAAVAQACHIELPDIAGTLALRLSGFFALRSYDNDWDSAVGQAIACVRDHGAPDLLVRLLSAAFIAHLRRDQYAELPAIAAEEVAVAHLLKDPLAQVRALENEGLAALTLARFSDAFDRLQRAVTAARKPSIPTWQLRETLTSLAFTHLNAGHVDTALSLLEEALDIDRRSTVSLRRARHLYHYGMALTQAERPTDAERMLTTALQVNREHGNEARSAYLEQALADVDIQLGRWSTAANRLETAQQVHKRNTSRDGLAEALRSRGDLAAAQGHWTDAIRSTSQALAIWRQLGSQVKIARALARLARAYQATGEDHTAQTCQREYQAILTNLELNDTCLHHNQQINAIIPHRNHECSRRAHPDTAHQASAEDAIPD